jgi:hypothetical protein
VFKFQILASTNDKPRASVIALTHFSDLAEFIADHAAEALDPDGALDMKVTIVERAEADKFAYRPRGTRED